MAIFPASVWDKASSPFHKDLNQLYIFRALDFAMQLQPLQLAFKIGRASSPFHNDLSGAHYIKRKKKVGTLEDITGDLYFSCQMPI